MARLVPPIRIWRGATIGVGLAGIVACHWGCGSGKPSEDAAPEPELRPAPRSIDEAVQRRLDDAGLGVTLAGDTELCRRMFADLVGRFPTSDEVASRCAGQEPEAIVDGLLGTEEYVVHGQRRWHDRIGSSDALLFWRDLVPAYDWVAQMLRGQLDYEQFAIALMAEPGLMALDSDPQDRAYRVHRVFLGGDPTQSMAQDLGRLTRIWDRRFVDSKAVYPTLLIPVPRAYIVPGYCGPLGACRTELYEGGSIDFPEPGARPFGGIKFELLTEAQRASLRGLGEHVVAFPWFWEAAADEVLDRLLGWNDGGSEPRRVGRVLPEVRALVVEHLQETKDLRSAERLVMTSLLYRQSHRGAEPVESGSASGDTGEATDGPRPGPRPIWASGPLKFSSAEVVLNTMLGSNAAAGTCDPRTGDDDIYDLNLVAAFVGLNADYDETTVQYNAFITALHQAQGNWRPLVEQEVSNPDDPQQTARLLHLDPTYLEMARAFGGCPGVDSPRLTALDGLSYAFGQEVAVNTVCEGPALAAIVGDSAGSAAIASALMSRLLSRAPTADELVLFDELACAGAACPDEQLARGICVALLGAHEMLFY